MGDIQEKKQVNPVVINHNMASMLDETPALSIVQVDENIKSNNGRITKEIIITALILVSVAMIEAFILLKIEHTIGKERLMRYLMIGAGTLSSLMCVQALVIFAKNKIK